MVGEIRMNLPDDDETKLTMNAIVKILAQWKKGIINSATAMNKIDTQVNCAPSALDEG